MSLWHCGIAFTVRGDRNNFSKALIESQDEITESKRKLKMMTHQIEQLKEEITGKDSSLTKVYTGVA